MSRPLDCPAPTRPRPDAAFRAHLDACRATREEVERRLMSGEAACPSCGESFQVQLMEWVGGLDAVRLRCRECGRKGTLDDFSRPAPTAFGPAPDRQRPNADAAPRTYDWEAVKASLREGEELSRRALRESEAMQYPTPAARNLILRRPAPTAFGPVLDFPPEEERP